MHGGRGHWGEAGVLGAVFGLAFAASRTLRFIVFLIIAIIGCWWIWTWMHDYTVPKDQYTWQSYTTELSPYSSNFNPQYHFTGRFTNLSPDFIEKANFVVNLYECPSDEAATEDCSIVAHDVKSKGMRVRPNGSFDYDYSVQFIGTDLDNTRFPRVIAHWGTATASSIDYDEE